MSARPFNTRLSESGDPRDTRRVPGVARAAEHSSRRNKITLAAGDNVTCTITNNDNAPSLTLDKVLNYTHGGTRPESDWTINATGTGGSPTNLSGPGVASSHNRRREHLDVQGRYVHTSARQARTTGYENGTTWDCVKNGNPRPTALLRLFWLSVTWRLAHYQQGPRSFTPRWTRSRAIPMEEAVRRVIGRSRRLAQAAAHQSLGPRRERTRRCP
jgi:hypothetical protein